MRYIIIILTGILLMGLGTNVNGQSKDKDEFLVKVDGLGCPFCAYGLEKKFKELKGMKNPKIDMETGIFTFTYPSEKGLTIQQVEKQVEAAGYTPVKVNITRANGDTESSDLAKSTKKIEGELSKTTFVVAGNCGMCEARIEKAAKNVKGVVNADWNKETKKLQIEFEKGIVDQNAVEQAIAKVGHDTKMVKATTKTYNELPGCCQYDRIK